MTKRTKEDLLIKGLLILSMIFLPIKGYALDVGDRAPEFHLTTPEGKTISFNRDLKAKKPVYLVFWTTWCPHCKEEFPQVLEMYRKFGGQIEFIGINLGIKDELEEYVKRNHISFPVTFDEGNKITSAFGAQIQTNILIDKEGVIRYKDRGIPNDVENRLSRLTE